jgi:hypothetical protein
MVATRLTAGAGLRGFGVGRDQLQEPEAAVEKAAGGVERQDCDIYAGSDVQGDRCVFYGWRDGGVVYIFIGIFSP